MPYVQLPDSCWIPLGWGCLVMLVFCSAVRSLGQRSVGSCSDFLRHNCRSAAKLCRTLERAKSFLDKHYYEQLWKEDTCVLFSSANGQQVQRIDEFNTDDTTRLWPPFKAWKDTPTTKCSAQHRKLYCLEWWSTFLNFWLPLNIKIELSLLSFKL